MTQVLKRRALLGRVILGLTAGLAGCVTAEQVFSPLAKRRAIDFDVDFALTQLHFEVKGSREFLEHANGYLVFPKVTSAGYAIGSSDGRGALRRTGFPSAYYRVSSASGYLGVGAKTKVVFIVFLEKGALGTFLENESWYPGKTESAWQLSASPNGRLDTASPQSPVAYFALTRGKFTASFSLEDTKISKLML